MPRMKFAATNKIVLIIFVTSMCYSLYQVYYTQVGLTDGNTGFSKRQGHGSLLVSKHIQIPPWGQHPDPSHMKENNSRTFNTGFSQQQGHGALILNEHNQSRVMNPHPDPSGKMDNKSKAGSGVGISASRMTVKPIQNYTNFFYFNKKEIQNMEDVTFLRHYENSCQQREHAHKSSKLPLCPCIPPGLGE